MNKSIQKQLRLAGASAVALLAISACSSSSDYNFESSAASALKRVALTPAFNPDPAAPQLPFPTDIFFVGSTDGTLNIPVADATDFSNPAVALNALDGFSTTEAITVSFAQPGSETPTQGLDATSIVSGDSVRLYEVTTDPATGAIASFVAEVAATDYFSTVAADGTTLAVSPLKPLKESTTYMVALLNGITDTTGNPTRRASAFGLVAGTKTLTGSAFEALEGLRLVTRSMFGALRGAEGFQEDAAVSATDYVAGARDFSEDSVNLLWSFTTQSITPVLQAVKDQTTASTINLAATGFDTTALGGLGLADIHAGTMEVPYYLDAPSADSPTAPLQTFWTGAGGTNLTRFNTTPIVQSTQTIPVLMTTPKTAAPAGGWPIVIFQHGITRSRADMLALADSIASQNMALIAIDMPLHGIAATDLAASLRINGLERSFDLDLRDNETGTPGQDGTPESSGTYFYNLQHVLNTRDNLRQAISDLFVLSASVGSIANVNPSRKGFIGLSLGAIVGSTFLAYDDSFDSATLASPGSGLSRLLAASPSFGPAIRAGLEGVGIDLESAAGQQFLTAAQTAVDSADPINHAANVTANTSVHLTQMNVDQVVIGLVPNAPLAGTVALATAMGLTRIDSTSESGDGWVRFPAGAHGAILQPGAEEELPITVELQTQASLFAANGGSSIVIVDESLVEPVQ